MQVRSLILRYLLLIHYGLTALDALTAALNFG